MIEIETRCGVPWFISLIHSAGQFIADCHLFGNQNKQLSLVSQFRQQTILLSKHAIQHPTGGKEPNLHVYQEGKMLQLCPYIGAHRGHFYNNIAIKTNNCSVLANSDTKQPCYLNMQYSLLQDTKSLISMSFHFFVMFFSIIVLCFCMSTCSLSL